MARARTGPCASLGLTWVERLGRNQEVPMPLFVTMAQAKALRVGKPMGDGG